MNVPDIENKGLIPEGVYRGKLVRAQEITQSTTKPGVFRQSLVFDISGREVFVHMFGYFAIIIFLNRHIDMFIGKEYTIKIKHRLHEGSYYLDPTIIWE